MVLVRSASRLVAFSCSDDLICLAVSDFYCCINFGLADKHDSIQQVRERLELYKPTARTTRHVVDYTNGRSIWCNTAPSENCEITLMLNISETSDLGVRVQLGACLQHRKVPMARRLVTSSMTSPTGDWKQQTLATRDVRDWCAAVNQVLRSFML